MCEERIEFRPCKFRINTSNSQMAQNQKTSQEIAHEIRTLSSCLTDSFAAQILQMRTIVDCIDNFEASIQNFTLYTKEYKNNKQYFNMHVLFKNDRVFDEVLDEDIAQLISLYYIDHVITSWDFSELGQLTMNLINNIKAQDEMKRQRYELVVKENELVKKENELIKMKNEYEKKYHNFGKTCREWIDSLFEYDKTMIGNKIVKNIIPLISAIKDAPMNHEQIIIVFNTYDINILRKSSFNTCEVALYMYYYLGDNMDEQYKPYLTSQICEIVDLQKEIKMLTTEK